MYPTSVSVCSSTSDATKAIALQRYKTFSLQNENSSTNLNPPLQNSGPLESNNIIDGVLRGYTNNCSFYVSGSIDLKPKPTIKNKDNNHINNYQRINDKTNRANYISDSYKNRNVISTTPNNYRRRDMINKQLIVIG